MTSEPYSKVAGGTAENLYVGRQNPGEGFHPAMAIPLALFVHADQVIE
ncbi:MAG TPA: hypothetical protein VGV06_14670 [Methylomirabilota bacterium]|nr:hypothetical protein [Methylomirabilota bacterium]